MSARLFWKQQFPLLLVHLLSMAALACFLALNGNNRDSILLILLTWAGVAGGWMVRSYLLRKHQLVPCCPCRKASGRPISSVKSCRRPPGRTIRSIIKFSSAPAGPCWSRSAPSSGSAGNTGSTSSSGFTRSNPIAASKLLCENHPSPASPALLSALEAIVRYTEQALYYARSEHTEKDYFIRELRLFDAVHQSIGQNKYLLLQNGGHPSGA